MKHIIRGCDVNDDTLAFEVMRNVIPGGGVFLGELHTVLQMRKGAIWMPDVSKRTAGSSEDQYLGVITRAREKAKRILKEHVVEPLPDDITRSLDEIMEHARRELLRG